MASREMVAIFCAFIALAVCPAIYSAPTPQTCAPVCNPERQSSVLKYEEGKTYIYNFETEVVTQLVGSTDEVNRIKVKGQAAVAAQSACDLVLTVQQIAITSSSGQAISRVSDIEGSSIRFAYTDGEIDSVCVSEDDPSWSANIKRAIVSMLGNRALNGDTETIETDVNGKCKTTYEVSGNKYTKTKDLIGCSNRDGGMANAFGVPYSNPSQYHSIPLFHSVLSCTQELGKGVIQNVQCNEGHSLDVVQSSGVRTDITSTLNLASVQAGIQKGSRDTNKRSCLLYDFGEVDDAQRQKAAALNAVDLLNKLCTEIESGTVSLKVPGLFLQLRKQLRHSRKEDLKHVDGEITSGKLCPKAKNQLRKILLDASAMSSGDGAISFLAEVLATDTTVQDTTKDLFIAYAAFAEHPGTNALEGVTTLISKPDSAPEFLLAASGLAHQYCRLVNENCGSNEQYKNLVNTIAQRVSVATEEESIEKVVVALQALGNLDSLTPDAVTALVNLIENPSTNQRLKVRALDAARRDPCQETLKKKASKIFTDIQESSQVRIQAYLTLAKCLTPEDVPVVQGVINSDEESNQVGAFVVSHVLNLLESANPDKEAQRKVFELITLRDFPSDIRKFSRNYEISAFESSMMNSGLALDSNVIFSQDSYIPRCANSNFTIAAFGRSYNLLELGLCVEDFDDVLEHLLGPTSKVRSITLDDIVREGADKIGKLRTNLANRFKRDVAVTVNEAEIDAIRNEVDIHERTGENGNGDVYVRILGTSILVESFSQTGLKRQPLIARIQRAVENLAAGVRSQNIDVTEPFMFMDDEIILPTSSGLPITVTTEGTSVLSLQITGNLDVVSLLKGNNGDMKAKITPSAATVVKAKMVLGSGPIESGLQVEGKIHSAAGVDLKVVRENRKLELRVNMPQERIQVIDVRSDIYWVEQQVDQLEKKTPMKTKLASRSLIDNQCSSTLTKVVGLKVCADVKVPQSSSNAPLFFLNGPSVLSVSIEKIEPSMEGYYLKVEGINDADTYGLDLLLDTPGSRTNRKISAQARAVAPGSPTPQYSLKVESPLSNVEVNYKRSFTDELVGAELKIAVDGSTYAGLAEVRKTPEGDGFKLIPLVQYQLPNGNPVKLVEGEINRIPGKKLNVNIKTGGPLRALRGSVKGTATMKQNDKDNIEIEYKDLEFASEVLGKVELDGEYKRHGQLVDLKINSKYGQEAQHTLSLDAKVGSPAPKENVLKITTRSSRREFLNFDLDWHLKRGDNSIDHKFEYTRGKSEPKVVIKHESEIKIVSRREFDVESELTIKHPDYNIDFHAEAEAKSVPGQDRHAKLEARLGETLKAKATYKGTGEFFSNYNILGNVVLGEKTYEVSEVATKTADNKRNYKTRVSVQPGFYYEANTDVYLKYEKGDFKSELSTEITSDQLENPIILKSNVVAKTDGYGAQLKLDARGKNYVDLQTTHQVTRTAGSPASYATKMKAFILNVVDAKLTNTYKAGNGDLVLDALLAKSGRKIAGTSKVQRNGETYDLKADLKWDAERDPSKAISLKSVTTLAYSELRIDSQNDITVIDKIAKVNLKGALARDILNGESTGEVDYTSPSGKTYSASTKVALENKRSVRAGKVYIRVAPPNVEPSDIEVGLRVSNLDPQERTFDAVAHLKANYRNEKDLKIEGELSSLLPGNYRSYAARLTAEGTAIPKPLAVSLKTDVKTGRIAVKGESTSPVKSSVDATIDFDIWAKKKTVGVKYSITTPIDRIQSLEGELKGGYLYNSLKNFELSHEISLNLNGGSPYSSKYLLSVLENEAKYNHELVSEGRQIVTVTADGKYDRRHLRANLNADVKGTVSKLNLDVEHQLPNIAITLKGESNIADAAKNFELKASNKKAADGTMDSELLVRVDNDEKLVVKNKLENSPTRKSIDAQVLVGDEAPKKLFLLFHEEQAGKWNVEALAKWGEGGKYISTKGSLTKLDGAFEGELSLDSPHLQANKYSVRVAKSLTDGKHGLDITVDGNNQRQIAIALTYGSKTDSNSERSFEGTMKVEGQVVGRSLDFNGNFKLDDTRLNRQRDGEEGRRVRASVEINANNEPVKINLLAKRSNKENHLQLSYCKENAGECRIGNIQLKHLHGDDGSLDYELRITAEQAVGGNNKETNGIVFQSRLDKTSRQFEHTGKLIISEEKAEQIGYRVYCSPNVKEIGGEILLPARVIALVVTGDKTSAGGYNSEIAFYIDKTKKADRKISLLFNIGEKTTSGDNAKGRTLETIFRHPDLGKDLKIQSRYAIGGDSTLLELETVLDVLQAGSEITATYTLNKQVVGDARTYKSALAVKSAGLHVNFGANSEVKYANRELSYKNVITYENRNREIKTTQIVLGVSKQRFNFEIDGPTSKLLSFISTYQSTATGGEIRYEIQLPGMDDTRIIRAIANTVSPRNVQLRTTTSTNSDAEYVEAFLGFRSNDELAAGVYDHRVDGRHVLGDVTLAMNGSRVLSVKSDWNKENAHAVLSRAQSRNERITENLRILITNAIEEVAQEARHVSSNIRSAAPSLEGVRAGTRQQLSELKQELEQNEDTKMILQRLKMGSLYLRQFVRVVLELARTARRIVIAYAGGLRDSLKHLPEKYSQILDRIPDYIEQLKELATRGVQALINGSRVASKVLLEAAERLYEALPPFADVWNWVVDQTEGVVQVLADCARKTAEKLAKVYAAAKDLVGRLLANRTIQALFTELRNKLQALLEEFIEDTKEQLESIRDYVLSAVPQKEFQEFIQALVDYIQKKAQKAGIDDAAALSDLCTKFKATIKRALSDIFSLDTAKGIFRAQIPLPVSLKSLSEFSKVFTLPSRPKINFRIPSYTYGLRELINQIRSGAAVNEILPPFRGYALLIGSKHYKTFDGRFFEFEGNCQYLLASDFDDRNFTVVVDYDRQGAASQKSIIFTDSENTVALKPDGTVVVNGQSVTLDNPKEAGNLLIERIGSWNIVKSKKGAVVGCSATEDVCAAKFDGFYHGKVLGLLGTMNLEKFDDLRLPSGKITPSIEEFTSSWKLDKQCTEPQIITTMIHATQSAEEKCKAALDSRRSSLRPCFGVVDPAPYKNVCEKLSQRSGYTEEKAVCTAAVGYSKACYLEFAKVDAAPACAAA